MCVQPCLTLCDPMAVASQAPLSMGLSRHEYCRGLQVPSRDLPDTGIEPRPLEYVCYPVSLVEG